MSTAANNASSRVEHAAEDPAGRADELLRDVQELDQCGSPAWRSAAWSRTRMRRRSNLALGHGVPFSNLTGARHHVTMTSRAEHCHEHHPSAPQARADPRTRAGGHAHRGRHHAFRRRRSRSTRSFPPSCPAVRGSTPTHPGWPSWRTAALLAAPRTRRLGATAAIALFVAVFPGEREHGAAVVGQAVADAAGRDRPAAAADPDDHRGQLKVRRVS